ncbi:MAG: TetR family transcriptional regulator [Propionibacteriaceae bacterium]|nr:TetR family transcriptional regulator [Propionibacteriaceae bacterium]
MPQRLVAAGLALLAADGAAGVTVRSVEGRAGAPHGSVRHHFGGLDGLWQALVDGLLELERPGVAEESVEAVVRRWLGPDAPIARARYELMLVSTRDPGLRAKVLQGRKVFVERLVAAGVAASAAEPLVAMLDGLVLDAILRGRPDVDLTLWKLALAAATTNKL